MKKYAWPLLIISLSALTIVVLTKGKTIMEKATETLMDFISEQRIKTLHPAIRDKVRNFVNQVKIELGITLRVAEANRSFERQKALYNQPFDGIDNDKDGRIDEADEKVTNATAGSSYHNYGLAFDVVPLVNGQPNWKSPYYDKIGAIGKRLGFTWGGDFKTLIDKPHFQYTFGYTWQQLLAKYNAGNRTGEYVNIA